MTKRRAKNKKPTGVNRFLGNSLLNEREKLRKEYRKRQQAYNAENFADMDKNMVQNIDSITDETGLEEFLAKAELAGTNFAAERGEFRMLDLENSKVIVNTINSACSLDELYKKYGDRLRIPRRPPKHKWETADDLTRLENEYFLEWRKNLAELQECHGMVLTPFERNLELWRQLWRVIDRSDIIVQILDARNPLLFRSLDLEAYIKECDSAKKSICLINKADLLSSKQIELWRKWFLENNIDAVFWSTVEPETVKNKIKNIEEVNEHNESESTSSSNESGEETECGEQDCDESSSSLNGYDGIGKQWNNFGEELSQNINASEEKVPIIRHAEELLSFFKSRGHVRTSEIGKPLIVGMVGYPNVGKSSTINKLLNQKKVSVSATPGKTRHLQTVVVDEELTLCDCPGLVMPSFALSRSEMILNGILSIDHMREYISPIELLLTRVPRKYMEKIYSVLLIDNDDDDSDRETPLSARDLLTAIAFIRGYMSSAGVADCSRAARLVLKDVVNGKVKWVAAPPNIVQEKFDKITYDVLDEVKSKPNRGIMQQLEKRHLLQDVKPSSKLLDKQFFLGSSSQFRVRSLRSVPNSMSGEGNEIRPTKKHHNKNKREKLRRIFVD